MIHCFRWFNAMYICTFRVSVCLAMTLSAVMHVNSQQGQIPGFTRYNPTYPGISSLTVIKTYEDHRGLMWFCTLNGADFFNGKNIQSFKFNAQDTNSIPAPIVAAMQQDDRGRYWFACIGGLGIYDPYAAKDKQWSRLYKTTEKRKGLPGDQIQFLQYDGHGHMWASTLATGLMKINVETFSVEVVDLQVPEDRLVKDGVGIDYSSTDTILYTAANLNFLRGIHVKTGIVYNYEQSIDSILARAGPHAPPTDFRVSNVFRSTDGTLWMTTRGNDLIAWNRHTGYSGVWRFGEAWQTQDRIYPMAEDREGQIWFGFPMKGLFILNRATGDIVNYLNNPHDPVSLASNTVHHILKDSKDNMWLSSYSGVFKFDPFEHPFHYKRPYLGRETRDGPLMRCYLQDAAGNEWVGTEKGLIYFPGGGDAFEEIPVIGPQQNHLVVQSLAPLSETSLLLGTGSGLYIFHIQDRTISPYLWKECAGCPSSSTGGTVGVMLPDTIDSTPYVWLGGWKSDLGLLLLNLRDSVIRFVAAEMDSTGWIPNDLIWDIEKDREGYVWIAARNGLRRIDSMNPWTFSKPPHFDHDAGVFEDEIEVKDVCFDAQNHLYAITTRGLVFQHNGHYVHGTKMFPGINIVAHNVFTDIRDNVWIVTGTEYIRYQPGKGKFAMYDSRIASRGNLGVSHFYQRKDGSFVYQNNRQLNIIEPDRVSYDLPPHQTYISDVQLFDTSRLDLFGLEHLRLRYTQNSITFYFASNSYSFSDLNQYRWELTGVDRGWTTVRGRNYAQYSALPHGHYTFRVQSRNVAGIWDETGATYSFTIVPPWYLSLWFKILVVVAGISVVWYVFQQRTQRLLAQQRIEIEKSIALEQERSRISRDMHDDLGSGLSAIHLLSGYIKELSDEKYPEFSADVEKIQQSSAELNQRIREIIWAIDSRDNSLTSLILFIERYAHEMEENTRIPIRIHAPATIPDLPMSGVERKNIFLCCKEALNNALKHAQPSQIDIYISLADNNGIRLEIRDNGKGFGEDISVHTRTGNGLVNIHARMREIQGHAEIQSQNNGTTVSLTLTGQGTSNGQNTY